MSPRTLLPALLLLAAACGRPGSHPNVLLISVDTLRHDRLGFAGYQRPVSPHLDSLAARGTVFPKAYSQSGWTLPSMATILTGRYPLEHGAVQLHLGMRRDLPTLAGILSREGYETRGYVSHVLLDRRYGFDRGFDAFDASILAMGNPERGSTSREMSDLTIEGIAGAKEPFFVWAHYFDPHFEYVRHADWVAFGDGDSDRYDQEIAFTDQQIGRLLDALRASGRSERTLVVFTADHGEEFGEHGGQYHYTLFDEVLRVPLVIAGPGVPKGRDGRVAEQIDLLPTILARLGIDPPPRLPGSDLFTGGPRKRPVIAIRERPPGFRQAALVDGDRKLVHVEAFDPSGLPPEAQAVFSEVVNVIPGTTLYDLREDPGEKRNLFSRDEAPHQELLRLLAGSLRESAGPPETVDLSKEDRERLRSLGYAN